MSLKPCSYSSFRSAPALMISAPIAPRPIEYERAGLRGIGSACLLAFPGPTRGDAGAASVSAVTGGAVHPSTPWPSRAESLRWLRSAFRRGVQRLPRNAFERW